MALVKKIAWRHELIEHFSKISSCPCYLGDLKQAVESGRYELWSVDEMCFFVTKVYTALDDTLVLSVPEIAGEFLDYLKELDVFTVALAKVYGCETIRVEVNRKGIAKLYCDNSNNAYKVISYTMQRQV